MLKLHASGASRINAQPSSPKESRFALPSPISGPLWAPTRATKWGCQILLSQPSDTPPVQPTRAAANDVVSVLSVHWVNASPMTKTDTHEEQARRGHVDASHGVCTTGFMQTFLPALVVLLASHPVSKLGSKSSTCAQDWLKPVVAGWRGPVNSKRSPTGGAAIGPRQGLEAVVFNVARTCREKGMVMEACRSSERKACTCSDEPGSLAGAAEGGQEVEQVVSPLRSPGQSLPSEGIRMVSSNSPTPRKKRPFHSMFTTFKQEVARK